MSNPKSAFTLIELIIVMAIMGILMTIGLASYNSFNRDRITRKAVDDIRTYLRMVGSRAKNNEKDTTVCNTATDTLNGWYFDFSPLRIYAACGAGPKTFGEKQISIPTEITLATSPIVSEILFYPPTHSSGNQTDLPAGGVIILVNGVEELKVDPSGNVSNL
ncbi:MAG TPA: type II secretion system protein [Candidatus Bathyarchaeia archaeon]|nr:type II secretion system protein [Candidatus Bathyarchaeia archaeon]